MAVKVIVTSLLTLFVISILTFAATSLKSPVDIARAALGRETPPAALEAYAQERGLFDPLPVRYSRWLGGFVTGDLGTSVTTDRPVADDVLPRMKNTLILSFVSLVVALPLSIALGVFMARRAGRPSDVSLLFTTVVLASLPEFIIGIGLVLIFGVRLKWFPVDSSGLQFGSASAKVKAYILPVATLVLAMLPHISRIARSAAVESLNAPYVAAAVLRGLRPRRITWDHAMRNAAVPLVNAVALNVVYLLGGVIVVEEVFAFPGIGQLFVEAIGAGDTPMVLSITMLLGIMFISISLIADLLVLYFNPRLKSAT
jgi:peptide/nickel transport system permease protein